MKKYSYKKRQMERKVENAVNHVKEFHWKYRNLFFLSGSIIVACILLQLPYFQSLLSKLEYFGYFGAFISGMFFSYGMTAAPATAVLFTLGKSLNPFLIALVGAGGTVIGDYIIFRFVKNRLIDEIRELSHEINNKSKPFSDLIVSERRRIMLWRKVSKSKIWRVIIPIIAGFIIASPLPDELGVALFGAVKYDPKKFILYSYLLNFLGILGLSGIARIK